MTKPIVRHIMVLLMLLLVAFSSCTQPGKPVGATPLNDTDTIIAKVMSDSGEAVISRLSNKQIDSLNFRIIHHYSENFNFMVKADSLMLVPMLEDLEIDTQYIYHDEVIVVANHTIVHGDSIDSVWVKVASDRLALGWIREKDLLQGVVPDDIISIMIDTLSNSRVIWMIGLLGLGVVAFLIQKGRRRKLLLLQHDQMDSFYPILFLILIALMATIYATIQNYMPWYWQEFYFHPSLNPSVLPLNLAVLVTIVWAVLAVFLATIDDIHHCFDIADSVYCTLELLAFGMLVYLFFSWTTLIFIGYILLPLFIFGCIYYYVKRVRRRFKCGKCGKRIHSKGKCPYCGSENK